MWLLLWLFAANKIPNFIKNLDVPSCVDCVHFIDDSNSKLYAKCKLFGSKERVSGEIIYDYAYICRNKRCSDSCGPDGKYYQAKMGNSTK